MPVINYCFGPLKVDQETMDIEKKLMKLHTDYSDLINERFDSVCAKGHPVNPPIWWLDPEDKTAQTVADGQVNFVSKFKKLLNIAFIYRISPGRNNFGCTCIRSRKNPT